MKRSGGTDLFARRLMNQDVVPLSHCWLYSLAPTTDDGRDEESGADDDDRQASRLLS